MFSLNCLSSGARLTTASSASCSSISSWTSFIMSSKSVFCTSSSVSSSTCFVLLIEMWDLFNGGMNVSSAVACTLHEPSGGICEPSHARLRHHPCPNQRKEQNHHRHKIRTRLLLHQSYQGREAYLHEKCPPLMHSYQSQEPEPH